MKIALTIEVESDVAAWLFDEATALGKSVSGYPGELLAAARNFKPSAVGTSAICDGGGRRGSAMTCAELAEILLRTPELEVFKNGVGDFLFTPTVLIGERDPKSPPWVHLNCQPNKKTVALI